ncbi:MAG: penicillin-binding protein 2 [Chloroflexi bacterium AL-W]|nr:penicillin-binding protein 2 [Chloroflexi bacterium AL-N1]NOK69089.1 penicillin-binding protein 2 [Chloroflexi bacterium AL-N10]NOK77072.1 penicillin-binding protein 2 [Chloroflexi bacterium AL-N5]NOK83717.1 penicillin-binding protein 2 [Chloroflexi bacterium AL-W]NOK90927.1 penicillin-binding protein 2 [Chloroflexi bacterium AL-N15]
MHRFARVACIIVVIVLIAYGLIQPVEQDIRWLLLLWLAAPFLLIAVRLSLPQQPRGMARSVQQLGVVVGVSFMLLALQLLRQQFVRADDFYDYVYIDQQTGQAIGNVRPVLQTQRVQRGKILDRNATVIVDTQMINGFAWRTYPIEAQFDPSAFGNVVGFFSHRFSHSGIEASYHDYLSGELDIYGHIQSALLGQQRIGDNVHLTIDARLQAAATQSLNGRPGSVVVLDAETGAILAMASAPTFDPRGIAFNPSAPDRDAENARVADYWTQINGDVAGQPLLNRPTQGVYPPGSIFKTLTAIAVLEHAHVASPNDIDCPNTRTTEVGAPPVVNALDDLQNFTGDPSDLERVYAYSCNTAFAEYAMRLGPDLFIEMARKFDVYTPQEAPINYQRFTDLPTAPSLLYVEPGFLNRQAALADTGYGQGQLLVTPLQMAMMTVAVANDGVMLEPYLVERITRFDGTLVTARGSRVIRRAMSSATAATLRADMRAGVEYGFGTAAQQVNPNVALVAGKSGTAEHGPGTVPHAWFIALAPVDEPRYAVAVMVESGGEGSSVGAQLAGEVLATAFNLEN